MKRIHRSSDIYDCTTGNLQELPHEKNSDIYDSKTGLQPEVAKALYKPANSVNSQSSGLNEILFKQQSERAAVAEAEVTRLTAENKHIGSLLWEVSGWFETEELEKHYPDVADWIDNYGTELKKQKDALIASALSKLTAEERAALGR